jgi:hypothetical protein
MNNDKELPKNIQEWRERHAHLLNERNQDTRPWQEIMNDLIKFCSEINGESK